MIIPICTSTIISLLPCSLKSPLVPALTGLPLVVLFFCLIGLTMLQISYNTTDMNSSVTIAGYPSIRFAYSQKNQALHKSICYSAFSFFTFFSLLHNNTNKPTIFTSSSLTSTNSTFWQHQSTYQVYPIPGPMQGLFFTQANPIISDTVNPLVPCLATGNSSSSSSGYLQQLSSIANPYQPSSPAISASLSSQSCRGCSRLAFQPTRFSVSISPILYTRKSFSNNSAPTQTHSQTVDLDQINIPEDIHKLEIKQHLDKAIAWLEVKPSEKAITAAIIRNVDPTSI